jgi:hypothetical protein
MDAWWRPALGEVFDGRAVVIAGGVPGSWGDYVEHLRSAGASRVMIVATEGPGLRPGPDVPTIVAEPPSGLTMMERVRWSNELLREPTEEILAAVDRFDPGGTAIAVGSFLNEAPHLGGRPFLAHRRPEWVAMEDKTVIDAFWDRVGIRRLPSAVVPVGEAADAAPVLDRGAGTVWSADAREGFHGGASATHWVADDASRARAVDALRPMCDRVRVMPFVDGIPCSIHGIVLPDGIAVLRPVEMVTLRRGTELVYAGCATFWDPPDRIRDDMRRTADAAGRRLRIECGFRGTFTIDGVVDADGFWPTELNPRFGVGLGIVARATGDIPILLVHELAVAGRPVGADATVVEAVLVAHADEHRSGGTWRATSDGTRAADGRTASFVDGAWEWADADTPAAPTAGTVDAGPSFTRCSFVPASTPVGESVGRRAAAFWRFADDRLGTGLGELEAAPDPFA